MTFNSWIDNIKEKIIPKEFDRLTVLMGILFILLILIAWRLFRLQVVEHGFYTALASDRHEISKILHAQRGDILMTDHTEPGQLFPLATNREYYQIFADPREVKDPVATAEQLSNYVTMPIEKLVEILSKSNDPYEPIEKKVTKDRYELLKSLNLSGIYGVPEMFRYYVNDNLSSHIVGFLGLKDDKRTGFYGIEGYFNDKLAGKEGFFQTDRDVAGRWIVLSEKKYEAAQDGVDIVLTIDRTLQFKVCQILNQGINATGARGGNVVILEPQSGKVLAMCVAPDYNPNFYAQVENANVYNNSAIFEAYEPGSVFKPLVMASALDLSYVQPDSKFTDLGYVKVDQYTIRNANDRVYGEQTMTEVLENSINTGMVHLATLLGNNTFYDYMHRFGFGQNTGIELQTEVPGNISALEKKSLIWGATASFGQGITVTPIQLASAFGALANGGSLMKPYIVEEIRYADGKTEVTIPQTLRQVISQRTSVLMGGMLTSVINNSYSSRAQVPGYYLAGKTGTAQIAKSSGAGYDEFATNHTFVGYGPVDDPKFVMVIRLDRPSSAPFAESTAAPIFAEIAQFFLQYYQIPPDY